VLDYDRRPAESRDLAHLSSFRSAPWAAILRHKATMVGYRYDILR